MQDGCELPCKVHRVPDSGIHALPADRTVNMRGVAEQECASVAKAIGYAMMHTVSGEPVHALHLDAHGVHYSFADIIPFEFVASTCSFIAHSANEPYSSLASPWKHGEKVGSIECDVEIAIHRRTAALHVSDVE